MQSGGTRGSSALWLRTGGLPGCRVRRLLHPVPAQGATKPSCPLGFGKRMAADACDCLVNVVGAVSGETLSSFRLPRTSPILEVKRSVQAAHGIGVFRQRLLPASGAPLDDGAVLGALAAPAGEGESEPLTLALLTLAYVEPDVDLAGQLLQAAEHGMTDDLERLLRLPCGLTAVSGRERSGRP